MAAVFLALGLPVMAQVPDLTNGGLPTSSNSINLGPTGLTGWMYHERDPNALLGDLNYTGQSRQILIKAVDPGSPGGSVGLQIDDVILGASGDGSTPVDFTSDARKSLALAIAAAEARTTPELKLKLWRAGSITIHTLTLQHLGAYGPDAPLSGAKCELILENCRQALMTTSYPGRFGFGTLALMALDDPNHPDHAAMKAQIDAEISAILPSAAALESMNSGEPETGGSDAWFRGHMLIVFSEYFLNYGEHPNGGVFEAIEAHVNSITTGQSIFGTFGHKFAQFRWPDGDPTPMMGGYGPINSSAVPGLYGLLLAKQCSVINPVLDEAIDRGLSFYGSYAGRGAIPYGEHEPAVNEFSTNGKSGSAALVFDLAAGRQEESKYYAKMSAASFKEYETGHTGYYFQNLWSPLGAALGGDEAIKAYFAELSWLYDLARKWDGSFNFNIIARSDAYGGFNNSVPYILTYALPLKRLHMTGRGRSAAGVLDTAERAAAVAAGMYDETTRSKSELIADLGDWSAVVKFRASTALGEMTLDAADMDALHAMASDPVDTSREGALMALEEIADASSASVLSAILDDPNPRIRRLAAKALRTNPAKDGELNAVLAAAAAAQRATFPLDPLDPLHMDLQAMAQVLFSSTGILYSVSSGVDLTGVDRGLLYPALRALLSCPAGAGRSASQYVFDALNEADVQALGDTLIDAVYYRAPADPMFADPAVKFAMDALVKHDYAEGIPTAGRVIRSAFGYNADRALYGDLFIDLREYGATSLLVTPDPETLKLCQDYIADLGAANPANAAEAQLTWNSILVDTHPSMPKYFKSFDWVVTDAAELTLPANQTQLHASVTDHAKGDLTYTWRKVYGPGNVAFSMNGSAESKDTTITFDGAPGQYLFEVTVIDARGLSEITEIVAMTLYDTDGTLPPNTPPTANPQNLTIAPGVATSITLTGSDPESASLVYTVTRQPTHGTLSGTAPDLIYTSDLSYHAGQDSFIFQVTDENGLSVAATVNMTIDPSLLVRHVYEPFDYPAGFLAGASGGTGMLGTWQDGPDAPRAYVYDETGNPGGDPNWDGVMDGFPMRPSTGSRYVGMEDVAVGDSFEAYRPLAQSAADMAGPDGVLWISAIWHFPYQNYGAHVGLALSTDSFKLRASGINTSGAYGSGAGDGIGVGRNAAGASYLSPTVFDGGSIVAQAQGQQMAVGDSVVILKIEFGATDKVSAYSFPEGMAFDEAFFESKATSVSYAIDESKLNILTFSQNRKQNAIDEIRIGTSFASVAGLQESSEDVTPPLPDPMTFAVAPISSGLTTVTMTATTATDASDVEYYFTCTSGSGHDSGWQDSPTYTDSGLEPNTEYSYSVVARDKSANQNVTGASEVFAVTTDTALEPWLVAYEPFDYAPVDDQVNGSLAGKNGGVGFGGPWLDSTSGSNGGEAFVYDSSGSAGFSGLYQVGNLTWDGVVDNLPNVGGYVGLSTWSNTALGQDRFNSHRPLAASAAEMAGEDGILWLSMVFHYPDNGYAGHPGIALTSGGNFEERAKFISNSSGGGNAIGIGNGSLNLWPATDVNTLFWSAGTEVSGTKQNQANLSGTLDNVIVLKFEFGATDSVSAYTFSESHPLTEQTFIDNAVTSTSTIDESTLNMFAFSLIRSQNAIDEIRMGNTFLDVVGQGSGGGADTTPPTLASTDIVDDQGGASVAAGTVVVYDVTFSEGMNGSTVDPTDFSNAGSASVTIGTVVEVSPSIYRVRANALTTGTLQLQVKAGVMLTDLAGNLLDTEAAILDDTLITVGPPMIAVPNLVGQAQATAEANIVAASLVVGSVTSQNDAVIAAGDVISQSPTGGSNVPQGSSVDMVVSLGPLTVDNVATGNIAVSGTLSGSFANTQTSDNSYQAIMEIESDGLPDERHSLLEHKWVFHVTGGVTVTFNIEAHHTANSESDDFLLAYSTTGEDGPYVNMVMVTKTSDNDSTQSFTMPSGTNGTVHVRIVDTNRATGRKVLDTLYVDRIYFLTSNASPATHGVSDYVMWAASYGEADLGNPDADLDGDGLKNDAERIWGLDPVDAVAPSPVMRSLDVGTDFRYIRRDRALTLLTYTVWTSTDLVTWTEDEGVEQRPDVPGPDGTQMVHVTLSPGLLLKPVLFVQVRAAE